MDIVEFLGGLALCGIFLVMPIFSFFVEVGTLFHTLVENSKRESYREWYEKHPKLSKIGSWYGKAGWIYELVMFLICFIFEALYLELAHEVIWAADWSTQLYNDELHQAINPKFSLGIAMIIVLYLAAMVFLYLSDVNHTPPLLTGTAIAALYLGSVYSIVWTIQVFFLEYPGDLFLLLLPINTVLISLRLIVLKVMTYDPAERSEKIEKNRFLAFLWNLQRSAAFFPVLGLLLVIPLLGIMALILILFGQAPDSAIKAFTETSDFKLSKQISPPNVAHDEHYLCTVAACGDPGLVKPLRSGVRHGHQVVVNRQLQIANAFEEIIMVKTPRFHRRLRHFYDTYGFPIAKGIKSPKASDFVYLLMKPLELLFVLVLYAVEAHPEDRICMQYTGRTLESMRGTGNK